MATFFLEHISVAISDLRLRLRVDTHQLASRVLDFVPLVVKNTAPLALPVGLAAASRHDLSITSVRGQDLHNLTVISWRERPWAAGLCLMAIPGVGLPWFNIEILLDRRRLVGQFLYPNGGRVLSPEVQEWLDPSVFWQPGFVGTAQTCGWPGETQGAPSLSFDLSVAEFEVVSEGAMVHLDRWVQALGRVSHLPPPPALDLAGWVQSSPCADRLGRTVGPRGVSELVASWRTPHG